MSYWVFLNDSRWDDDILAQLTSLLYQKNFLLKNDFISVWNHIKPIHNSWLTITKKCVFGSAVLSFPGPPAPLSHLHLRVFHGVCSYSLSDAPACTGSEGTAPPAAAVHQGWHQLCQPGTASGQHAPKESRCRCLWRRRISFNALHRCLYIDQLFGVII